MISVTASRHHEPLASSENDPALSVTGELDHPSNHAAALPWMGHRRYGSVRIDTVSAVGALRRELESSSSPHHKRSYSCSALLSSSSSSAASSRVTSPLFFLLGECTPELFVARTIQSQDDAAAAIRRNDQVPDEKQDDEDEVEEEDEEEENSSLESFPGRDDNDDDQIDEDINDNNDDASSCASSSVAATSTATSISSAASSSQEPTTPRVSTRVRSPTPVLSKDAAAIRSKLLQKLGFVEKDFTTMGGTAAANVVITHTHSPHSHYMSGGPTTDSNAVVFTKRLDETLTYETRLKADHGRPDFSNAKVTFYRPGKSTSSDNTGSRPETRDDETRTTTTTTTATRTQRGSMASNNHRRTVLFQPQVKVQPIPSRTDYSNRIRRVLWISSSELQENAARNCLEFAAEGWDWQNVVDETEMIVVNGERIHPVHFARTK